MNPFAVEFAGQRRRDMLADATAYRRFRAVNARIRGQAQRPSTPFRPIEDERPEAGSARPARWMLRLRRAAASSD